MIGGFLQVGVPCVSLARLMRLSSHIFWFICLSIELRIFFCVSVETDTRNVIELLLRRPSKDKYRLDRLLERKAKEGVKIYIIL